ncbi:LysR family transcriptional regulator [Heyndrickxia acidicola]|uniref:LysR family transcriptional regulator n=1 Tax=Heyndrickxia acidicola TaxID=209389 RepID=A0ABU6MEE1_9BACI|nr:LysR family transcriptional regulator [Heyndrickxia acidicola]MED1203029.1 LysR family transcriptional regulator [Heyndrickxia acidicola]
MDIRQLGYFIEVAAQMSFSKAAEQLNISQPSLSKMVKNLEDELGTVLFDRTTKKMELTDAGKVVIVQAKEIMKLIRNLSSDLSDVMEIKKGSIKIGIPPVIGSLFFPKLVSDFQMLYPKIEVELVEKGAKKIEKFVEEGIVDVGVALLPVDESLFEIYPFASRELKLIVHPEHPLANLNQVSLVDLKNESFILMREDFALHDRISEACIQSGFEPTISFESSQWDFISEMVANRLGVAIFPDTLCEKLDSKRIKAVSIVNPGIPWNLALIWRKNKYLSYVSKEFIHFFRNTFQN